MRRWPGEREQPGNHKGCPYSGIQRGIVLRDVRAGLSFSGSLHYSLLEFWLNGLDQEMERLKGEDRSGLES